MINRREFVKLSSLLPISQVSGLRKPGTNNDNSNQKNILVVVFDAFSACNIPFYGYPRNTTPYLSSLLDKSIVYHRHFAGGNFTSPGTASLFTGVYPWTHRSINLRAPVIEEYESINLFTLFDDYYRLAYTQNNTAHALLKQLQKSLDYYIDPLTLYIGSDLPGLIFKTDSDISRLSARRIYKENSKIADSLFLEKLYHLGPINKLVTYTKARVEEEYADTFPRGIPDSYGDYFTIETAIDWLNEQMLTIPNPFLVYFHLLPPHADYKTSKEFFNVFAEDGYISVDKPVHELSSGKSINYARYKRERQFYDEYILYVDAEFKRLYDFLSDQGILDDTIVIFTSDHGEIFERGYHRHNGLSLYQPLVHVPLIIFDPDNTKRVDIHQPTSAVDILPTLLHLSGRPIPKVVEGQLLPPYDQKNASRDIFALQAEGNLPRKQITSGTAMVVRDEYKLTYYFGYPELAGGGPLIELYNLDADPEELENLYHPADKIGKDLLESLLDTMQNAEKPYV